MPSQKAVVNLPLKVAIWGSGKRQRQIAAEAVIPETRLSEIVNQRGPAPSTGEKLAIARALGQSRRLLFPIDEVSR